jgi:hypothetical protein
MRCPHCKKRIDFVKQGQELVSMWKEAINFAAGWIYCSKCGEYAFEMGFSACVPSDETVKDPMGREVKIPKTK